MEHFVRKYQLSKTLRFELKPVGETADKIEDFKNQAIKEIVEQDRKRAGDYQKIKKIIDDYHRYFIEQVLSQDILTQADIQKAFEGYIAFKESKDENKRKDYQDIQKTLRSTIAKAFEIHFKDYGLFDAGLLNEKGAGENKTKGFLWLWLKDRLDNKQITPSEFTDAEGLIKSFDRFSTYFTGFNQNRENIYSAEEQQTAISYRIVHDNMVKHFNNCLNFRAIQKGYTDLAEKLSEHQETFVPAAFIHYLGQTAINQYNEIIGHKSDDIHAKGINQIINEYCQKNSNKDHKIKIPKMAVLYKQILSDVENKFKIDAFANDCQMLETINTFYLAVRDDVESLKSCLSQYLIGDYLDKIYIKNDASLTDISQRLLGDWSLIGKALEKYAFEKLEGRKTVKEKWLKQDCLSVTVHGISRINDG